MSLFDEFPGGQPTAPSAPGIATPLGELCSWVLGNGEPLLVVPSEAFAIGEHGRRYVFRTDGIDAELIVAPYEALYPDDMDLRGARAAIWRLRALADVPSLCFSCEWAPDARDSTSNGPESGEHLDSQSWIGHAPDGDWKVAVGTEGGDALIFRARRDDWLPVRLAQNETWPEWTHLHREDGFVEWLQLAAYRERGLCVNVPPLRAGERVQCQFLVAWAPAIEDEIATWFAVERLPHELLPSLRF